MTSVAALQSWICMLATYLRWYRGFQVAMKNPDRKEFQKSEDAQFILDHRGFGQPYVCFRPRFLLV